MRLKDLVWHSSLRNRAAGEVDVDGGASGLATHVFEATDLLVPAGTDWSNDTAHSLGSFEIPVAGQLVAYNLYIETSAPLGDVDQMTLMVDIPSGTGADMTLQADISGLTTVWAHHAMRGPDTDTLLGDTSPEAFTVEPRLVTWVATTADITVVRARAAFLVV